MSQKKNIPKRRFKEFQDAPAWEQRKLGEVGSLLKETVYPSKHPDKLYHEYSMPNYDDWKTPKVVKGNSMLSNRIKIKGNVLLINKLNVHQRRIWYVQTSFEDSVASGEFLPYISKEVNLEMLSQVLLSDSSTLDLISLSSGSSNSQKRITPEEFMKYNVMFPTDIKEQNMIAKLLNSIDKHISLHQRKLDKLRALKESYLSKMFPAEGQDKPELRFKGFTDVWEERKLGEMSEKMEYGLNAPAMEYDGANKYLRITDIDEETREFTKTNLTSPRINLSESAQYLLAKKDILFARTGASVGKTYCYREEDGDVYFAGFLIRARIKKTFDEEFIFQYTLTKMYSDYINVISQRSGQPGVNANEYSNLSILTPNLSEQEKIGLMHRKIDSLISLHQRKLDKLKSLKEAYLAEMFV